MQITDVTVKKLIPNGSMKAIATITFDNEFVVHNIKVIEKADKDTGDIKTIIAMPSRRTPNGEHKDVAHPINQETRKKIEDAILAAYKVAEEPVARPKAE